MIQSRLSAKPILISRGFGAVVLSYHQSNGFLLHCALNNIRKPGPVKVFARPLCKNLCKNDPSLPYPVYESLKRQFAQFTWKNSVELTCGDKQRNRENLNFKSVTSASAIWETTSVGRKTIVVRRINVIQNIGAYGVRAPILILYLAREFEKLREGFIPWSRGPITHRPKRIVQA
jgi:hypothetical protein